MGPFIVAMVAIGLWPLIVISIIDGMLVVSLLWHIPRIWANYRSSTWLWWALAVVVLAVGIGTWLVMRDPVSNWPTSLAAKPGAMIGLLLAGWALFGWVVTTERQAHQDRLKEESLDAHLQAF